jgi:hypothetical protein
MGVPMSTDKLASIEASLKRLADGAREGSEALRAANEQLTQLATPDPWEAAFLAALTGLAGASEWSGAPALVNAAIQVADSALAAIKHRRRNQ